MSENLASLKELLSLDGKVALVTGASRGIGRAIAKYLAMAGATVIVNYRSSKEKAEELKSEIESLGGKALIFKCDVSNPDEVNSLREGISRSGLGKVTIVVNNAGITRDKLLKSMTLEDWDIVLNTNLRSVFLVTKAFLPDMILSRWGRIINVSSIVGLIGSAGQANYAASKAGIIGFTKSIAKEYARFGITANVVAPGYIETDMTADLPEKVKKGYISMIPVGRAGTPEEVAAAVLCLASPMASYVNGEVLNVNGGMY